MTTGRGRQKKSNKTNVVQERLSFQETEALSLVQTLPTQGKSTLPRAPKNGNGAKLGFEEKLWGAADKLRGHMDASEYKHVVLGLVFLKYLSDIFFEQAKLLSGQGIDIDQKDAFTSRNTIWLPNFARWDYIENNLSSFDIPMVIDFAMEAIERENSELENVLPKNYTRSLLNPKLLSELVTLIGTIGLGDEQSRNLDILGRVYEYFLGRFASLEGKGGEFYTPRSVVSLLIEMVEPFQGKVYDPCCGSGGMFVQSKRFVQAHGGKVNDLSIFGQESNPTTWRLCKMNLFIRGIKGDIGPHHADTFREDLHKGLLADYIIANPPFNMSDWGLNELMQDNRWTLGIPPAGNANFAWIQHKLSHLDSNGLAGFVLSNGSLSASQSREEGSVRRRLIEEDLIDCIVALPANLFYTTQIAACLWIITKNKNDGTHRNRKGEVLFIYAYQHGTFIDRIHKELTEEDIATIATTYHSWKDQKSTYQNIPGFCKSVNLAEIQQHKHALVPGRYVGFSPNQTSHWDISTLRSELSKVEMRVSQANTASQTAISLLKELLNG